MIDLKKLIMVVSGGALLTGCNYSHPTSVTSLSLAQTEAPAPTTVAADPTSNPIKTYARAQVACNPLTGSSAAVDYNLGLAARLYYSPNGGPQYSSVEDYMNHGTDLGVDIFFNQVNMIPTYFANGFASEAGPAFQTQDGTVLTEWFGIQYKSVLRLTSHNAPGNYQLASLSDDGSILYLDPTGTGANPVAFINSDGLHAPKLACATSTLRMSANTHIPMQLDFFQGPRYHIANMLLWRRIPDALDPTAASSLHDDACGAQGTDVFFHVDQTTSVPTTAYQDLLNRGWEVIPEENFVLPETDPANPCFPGGGLFSS